MTIEHETCRATLEAYVSRAVSVVNRVTGQEFPLNSSILVLDEQPTIQYKHLPCFPLTCPHGVQLWAQPSLAYATSLARLDGIPLELVPV